MGKLIDLTGKTFGNWEVISRAPSKGTSTMWLCRCKCGIERDVSGNNLKRGNSISCGCTGNAKNLKPSDYIGKRYGRLLVIDFSVKCVGHKQINTPYFVCRCDCGTIKEIKVSQVKSGDTVSCGCYGREMTSMRMKDNGKKGYDTKSRLYRIWSGIKVRCYNKNHKDYALYGAKGVRVCDEWFNNYTDFQEWSLVNGYADNLSIDRIDTNGNYEPSNCRWTTALIQGRNKKVKSNSGTGIRGVQKSSYGTYYAIIGDGKTNKYIGSYKTIEEATKARKDAELRYWGDER